MNIHTHLVITANNTILAVKSTKYNGESLTRKNIARRNKWSLDQGRRIDVEIQQDNGQVERKFSL